MCENMGENSYHQKRSSELSQPDNELLVVYI